MPRRSQAAGSSRTYQSAGPDRPAQRLDVLGTLGRHPVLIVGTAVVVGLVALFFSLLQPDRYTAEARLFMSSSSAFDPVGAASYVADPDRYIANQAAVVTSEPVLAAAVQSGAAGTTAELREQLDVAAELGRDEILIAATGSTANQAALRADLVAEAYRDFAEQAVQRQTEELVALSTTSAEKADVLKRAAVFGDGVALLEEAARPASPSSPQPLRDALLGGLVGLALGAGLALLVDRRGRPADDDAADDVAQLTLDDLVGGDRERQAAHV